MTDTCVAILGAGLARRFGSGKLDALLQGKPLGSWAAQTAIALGIPPLYVVGPTPPAFLARLAGSVEVVTNPHPERGLSSSIALAAERADGMKARRLLILLGDMPFLAEATLRRLIDETGAEGASACVHADGSLGPPVCFGRSHFQMLMRLEGDRGAKSALTGLAGLRAIAVPPSELVDVDEPSALAGLNRQSRQGDG